ncbi:hypothetical protein N7539_008773 [Penicillium diatomitis]|uniref:ubiquitinyl hydrolase 1 n=1 Tax=Penicillium diatomitis TaxID=2819901 RepID=A0A9X0BLL5_9EURO|nr:uncharacterized protein N7539_008773 [Penicillium diatomitis]KAJ5471830.1 hypothetical protein N7539_008773 [Penicillium diatomitis]
MKHTFLQDIEGISYLFHHIFLPPKLPQEDDYSVGHEVLLTDEVIDALCQFKSYFSSDEAEVIGEALTMITRLRQVHGLNGEVDEGQFSDVLRQLKEEGQLHFTLDGKVKLVNKNPGGFLPIYVHEQNAAILISNKGMRTHVECFELSPVNEAVMSTKGRLQRTFPGPALIFDTCIFNEPDLLTMLAQTISRMSQQPVAGTKPKIRKANRQHDEDRDTTDPKMIVDFLMATLRPLSKDGIDEQIQKRCREEVMWRDCRSPWRRSALWLLIRVALQLVFSRLCDGRGVSQLYKSFLIYFMGSILDKTSETASHEMLHLMTAKVVRRLMKLSSTEEPAWFAPIQSILQRVGDITQTGWQRIVGENDRQIDFESLRELEFKEDTECSMPRLDCFLRDMGRKDDKDPSESFQPSSQLMRFEARKLPIGLESCCPEYVVQNLCGFEDWVDSCLGSWIDNHLEDAATCTQLGRLISEYHKVALSTYLHNPEATSMMLLTLLELWIACDKSAIRLHPHLEDYDHCIPIGCFYSLLLPFKSQMIRLGRAEEYLDLRQRRLKHPGPGVFRDYGTRSCFSVRYFDQSDEHQQLLRAIEEQAKHDKDQKRAELVQKHARYTHLMTLASETICQYDSVLLDRRFSFRESRHSQSCPCRGYISQAESIKIDIHEWPLPTNPQQAKSTVFELRIPEPFRGWRDATLYVLHNCLGVAYSKIEKPRSEHRLKNYQGLSSFFSCSTDSQRICLLSQVKPHQNTHRRKRLIIHVTEDDVCLNNALQLQYFDNTAGCFVSSFERKEETEIGCTYQLPQRSSALQKFLFRPASQPHGPSPNTVIATQNAAPVEMSLAEYKALAAMPLGLEIQWQNILLELSMPLIDMKKVESALFFRQIVHQAGLPRTDTWMRCGHAILRKPKFTARLLSSISKMAERMKGNWNLVHGYHTLINLLLRILSLSPCEKDHRKCLDLLRLMRQNSFQWVESVRAAASGEIDDARKVEVIAKAVHIALVCVQTFDTETDLQSFDLSSDVSLFLRCCMIIWNGRDCLPLGVGSLQRILYYRWQVLCYHSRAVLAAACSVTSFSPIDSAISEAWAAYPAGSIWSEVSPSVSYWLHALCSESTGERVRTQQVHYNLLTGELLVNGLPLAHLPAEYMSNQIYRILFGERSQLEVMPSDQPGMQFSCRAKYCGHTIHLGMTPSPGSTRSHLAVKAVRDGQAWVLVPKRLFLGYFPDDFIHNHAHWYAIDRGYIEFRPLSSPWISSEQHWRLRKGDSENSWRLENREYHLVGSRSKTADTLARILNPLEKLSGIHCRLDKVKFTLYINLPRLRLEFVLPERSTAVQCRQYPGMTIDAKQACNALVGLYSKLILVNTDSFQRIILIPEGDVAWSQAGDHVQVNVLCEAQWHAYSIDERLGRFVDNGSLQSKLFLAYLHAITSYFLPDPLTRRTGTEQALSILRSASVRSFDRLRPENVAILTRIATLTPQRRFYPDNEQVMQSVEWRHALSCLSQHPGFYEEVAAIQDQNSRVMFYYPGEEPATPSLPSVNQHLLLREKIRTASFRVSQFGSEDHTGKHDRHYASRDANRCSPNSTRAFTISKMLCCKISRARNIESGEWLSHVWKFLTTSFEIRGPGTQIEIARLRYSAEWILTSQGFIAENWCAIQQLVSSRNRRFNKYQLLIWLSTVAYSAQTDMIVVETIASLYLNPEVICEYTTIRGKYQPGEGCEWDRGTIQTLIEAAQLHSTPEDRLEPFPYETHGNFESRIRELRIIKRKLACKTAADYFYRQWPTHSPSCPAAQEAVDLDEYLDIPRIITLVTDRFSIWVDNGQLRQCLASMINQLCVHPVQDIQPPPYPETSCPEPAQPRRGYVSFDDLMAMCPLPNIKEPLLPDFLREDSKKSPPSGNLLSLIDSMGSYASSPYEKRYVEMLRDSVKSLSCTKNQTQFTINCGDLERSVGAYLNMCERYNRYVYTTLISRLLPPSSTDESRTSSTFKEKISALAFRAHHTPRLSPILLLEQLSRHRWSQLATPWRSWFILYGLSITKLQQAQRLCRLVLSPEDFLKEIRNSGHINWDPFQKPENLLLEIESGILIRPNQETIAMAMTWSTRGQNIVLQLNMGDGKSSVVVPIVAAAHANGRCIARVLTPKPQSRQMYQMLVGKLGGLLDRRVYQLPFSRSLSLGEVEVEEIQRMCYECMSIGGVLLVQPEHILSLKLMCLECFIIGKPALGRTLLQTLNLFREYACDIIDESDETFNAKSELIYSMGTQRPVELSPQRWVLIQELLYLVELYACEVKAELPDSIEFIQPENRGFPRIRVLDCDAEHALLQRVATHICEYGIGPLPIARQPRVVRQAFLIYILKPEPTADEIFAVESSTQAGFWDKSMQSHLLLLRGLLAGGVLAFCLGRKRWRVNYGPDSRRDPSTRLAVPYRAKDCPSLRSEFSHPDVVILLTCLQYYYSGLTNSEILLAFNHLAKSDEAEAEYQAWAQGAPMLETGFRQLVSVNLDDEHLCTSRIFPALRFSKTVVDYFLAQIVFPKEIKEFADKLSASGWDTGELRTNPTVGFSGTNDSRKTLPLTVKQLDLPEQNHTNALILEYLLRRENSVVDIPTYHRSGQSDVSILLELVAKLNPLTKVILDVGAQILELNNFEVARQWLSIAQNDQIRGAIFVNDEDNICVVDTEGRVELLQTSPFAFQMEACLVFLDEAHTRGIDLKLPVDYRAAVTLGPGITKDKLVQACMRMRKLGHGQSVIFCIPGEIKRQILSLKSRDIISNIGVSDVVQWAILETWQDMRRSMPLWAVQGCRFEKQKIRWQDYRMHEGVSLAPEQAETFLEPECQTLEQRYRPPHNTLRTVDEDIEVFEAIHERCSEFEGLAPSASLDEEQERELAPEIESEREDQRPPAAQPAAHRIDDDVVSYIESGMIRQSSNAYQPAFSSLHNLSAASQIDLDRFHSNLLATADFINTVQYPKGSPFVSDAYQRSVRFILSTAPSVSRKANSLMEIMIISPYEANFLMPAIEKSKAVALHVYAPRYNRDFAPLDRLTLYTTPTVLNVGPIPGLLRMQLNLFAGQLYLESYRDYQELCAFLGVASTPTPASLSVAADGFIHMNPNGTFPRSPLRFIKFLLSQIRKDGRDIRRTHLGLIVDGQLLTCSDVEESALAITERAIRTLQLEST